MPLPGRLVATINKNPGKPLHKNSRLAGVKFIKVVVYCRLVLAAGKLGGSAVGRARLQPRSFYLSRVYGKYRLLSIDLN